jgi:hypothetical protein
MMRVAGVGVMFTSVVSWSELDYNPTGSPALDLQEVQ